MRRLGLLTVVALAACAQILGDDFEIADDEATQGSGAQGGTPPDGGAGPGGGPGGGGSSGALAHEWSARFGGPESQYLAGLAVDLNGNVAIAGSFQNQIAVGGLSEAGMSAAWDGFVAKLDGQGVPQWLVTIESDGAVNPQAAAVDDAGSIYVGGFFDGSTDFGSGPWTSSGGTDAFIVKRDLNGGHVWSQSFFGPFDDFLIDLAVGPEGLAVVGNYGLEIDLGGGLLTSAAAAPMFVGAFGLSGEHLASRTFGSQGSVYVSSVALDGRGHVYVAGAFDFMVAFDGTTLNAVGGQPTGFVAKLTFPALETVWASAFGSAGGATEIADLVAAGSLVVFAGSFEAPLDFGGGALPHGGGRDAFVVALGGQGNHFISRAFGDHLDQRATRLGWLASGGLAVVGELSGTITTDVGDITAATGSVDAFFLAFSMDGMPTVARRYGSDDQELFPAVATTPDGVIFAVTTTGTLDLGGGPLPPQGGLDLALVRLR